MKKTRLLAVVLWLCSCAQGTNTGNPDLHIPVSATMSVAFALINDSCARVASCFPMADVKACMSQVPTLNGYTSVLGAPADTFPTMTALADAEVNHTVTSDPVHAETCRTAIRGVSCTSPLMTSSFDQTNPASYAATHLLFGASTSCRQIY